MVTRRTVGRVISRTTGNLAPISALGVLIFAPWAMSIDLVFRPDRQNARAGQPVDMDLVAFPTAGSPSSIAAIELVLTWDATSLTLIEHRDPCPQSPCSGGTFPWTVAGFPDDSAADGLNNTFDDGTALFRVFASFTLGDQAGVTADGLWITTFRFLALRADTAGVDMRGRADIPVQTRVLGGSPPEDITGTLGAPAMVMIDDPCLTPMVEAVGSRYLAITPIARLQPVALRIFGDFFDDRITCLSPYVQPDGTLGRVPVFLPPSQWTTVMVSGREIIPNAAYAVQTICQVEQPAPELSPLSSVTTCVWGDTDGDGVIAIDDVSRVLDAAEGNIGPGVVLENLDLAPCRPDGVINEADIQAVGDALRGGVFSCQAPCATGFNLDDFAAFQTCWTTTTPLPTSCVPFDLWNDGRINLRDFQVFQSLFDGL